ncbi:hypothetical protein N8D56_09275 [Devosia sp. A8/3-2]|nr:hypothetical protein N8D56_09275 [Devosia sp. A8/3-2]
MGGGAFPGVSIFADSVQTVTWSVLVCTGVAIGVTVSKARKAPAGLMGLLFAPLALAVAKAGQKAMLALIGALEQPAALSRRRLASFAHSNMACLHGSRRS